ncbi:uncharacterized protein OCT59_005042 [Rhizophagus irregularis]|uniref:uncharacterized protein n=1 Tax=Rhizophagus irregularis TaxID=588596 RepID=UPI000CB4DC4B|nr:hypothetical protein OCT59_005042 [Rhizophagus irregularis]
MVLRLFLTFRVKSFSLFLFRYTHLLVSISIRSRYSFDFDKTCVRMSGKIDPIPNIYWTNIFIGKSPNCEAIWAFDSNKEFS